MHKHLQQITPAWFGFASLGSFARYFVHCVRSGHSLQVASALAYTTLLSLVPLIAVTVGFLGALPGVGQFEDPIRDFIFENFVPAFGETIEDYLGRFADKASQLTLGGIAFLVVIALMLMATIENAFNDIWRVSVPRRPVLRFLVYWLILTLGPILVGAGLASTSYLMAMPGNDEVVDFTRHLLSVMPFLLTSVALVLLYVLIPNCHVPIHLALIGGVGAAIVFETAKYGFAYYVTTVPTYEAIYGALAVLPIFLIWIYVSWTIVLLGAQLTYSLGTFRPETRVPVPERDWDLVDVCLLLGRLWRQQRDGGGVTLEQLMALEKDLAPEHIIDILNSLQAANWVLQRVTGEWVLIRDLSEQTLLDLHRLLPHKLPDEHMARIPRNDLERELQMVFDRYRGSLQQALAVPVKSLWQEK